MSLYFGILTCGAGFLGILSGGFLAQWVKKKHPSGDALVCAFGLMSSAVFLFFAIYSLQYGVIAVWVSRLTMTSTFVYSIINKQS